MRKEVGKNRETSIVYSPRFMLKDNKGALKEVRKFWERASGRIVEVNVGDMGEVTISFKDIRMLRKLKTPRKVLQEIVAI